jgi:hypothetical protein
VTWISSRREILTGTSISGNSLSNFSISSSPVTLTGWEGTSSKSSKEKPALVFEAAGATGRLGMSPSPSREISGKADAAFSKSMSSDAVVRLDYLLREIYVYYLQLRKSAIAFAVDVSRN